MNGRTAKMLRRTALQMGQEQTVYKNPGATNWRWITVDAIGANGKPTKKLEKFFYTGTITLGRCARKIYKLLKQQHREYSAAGAA